MVVAYRYRLYIVSLFFQQLFFWSVGDCAYSRISVAGYYIHTAEA